MLLFLLLLVSSASANIKAPRWPKDYAGKLQDGATFDFIVVGAGAAGAAAASRLALAGHHVLLVEAGGDPTPTTRVPGLANGLLRSELNWAYPTVPNKHSCLSARNNSNCCFSRGLCLGGSTSINNMIYIKGDRRDFNDWDIDGWTYKDVKPFFLRFEGLQDLNKLPPTSAPYHNTTGIMKLGLFEDSGNTWRETILEGMAELNFPYNADVHAASSVGVTESLGFVYKGERMSTARAYLAKKKVKAKLKVAKKTQCTKVIIDENQIAVGIEVTIKGSTPRNINLYTRKDIILSAGAIGTPQILMQSGIGPAQHLREMRIKVKVDLPVGDNMSDQVLALLFIKGDRGFPAEGSETLPALTQHWIETLIRTVDINNIQTFFNSQCFNHKTGQYHGADAKCKLAKTQLFFTYKKPGSFPPSNLIPEIAKHLLPFTDEVYDQLANANKDSPVLPVSPILLRPYSKGKIRLASTNGLDKPAIYANYLEDERDVEELVDAIRVLEKIVESDSFKRKNASIVRIQLKHCPKYEQDSRAYWCCYVRHMTYAAYHSVGTASLGTVVDERLNVKGVRNLRVADLSVVPVLPRGNTEALAVAIGERMAEFLKED